MQANRDERKRKIIIKKASRITSKAKKKRNYELGKYGPFKPSKRSKSIGKKVNRIKIMK
jgi:hypothetical protein